MEAGAYQELLSAYEQLRGMIVIQGFYALVAGIIITTFIFRLNDIIKDGVHDGKGFNMKHFYELGREYIFSIAIIILLPVLLNSLEVIFAYGADELTKSLGGAYNQDNIWKEPIKAAIDKLLEGSITDIVANGLDVLLDATLAALVGSFFGVAYEYIMTLFLCNRYLILLLLEIVSPIAIACLYNKETRSFFFTWIKAMFGCYMLFPAFVVASIFSDLVVTNYIMTRTWPIVFMVIFSFITKTSMLATAKATINRWL